MFRVKICGITNIDDALAAADAGADAIGLNFHPGSKRCIDAPAARQIVEALDQRVDAVGVFVNESADRIHEICRHAGLRLAQLHGDEPPEFLGLLKADCDVIRARKLDERGLAAIESDLQACRDRSGVCPAMVLIDSTVPGQHGGTGQTVDWKRLVGYEKFLGQIPLALAGGLTPHNVAEAIRTVRPHSVDVASGVELAPGKKDHGQIREFVAAARDALGRN